MRILELNTFCGVGSTGRIALDIARYASCQGDETVIGFGAGDVPPEAETYALRIGGRLDRKWHGAIRKLLDMEGYGSVRATKRLLAFVREYDPDVIHLHNVHGCYLNLKLLFTALRASGKPIVWTLHDCWPFTGHCAYFDYIGCDRWRTECHDCPQQRSYPTCIGLDGSRRNRRRKRELFADLPNLTVVTPCEWLGELVDQSLLAGAKRRVIVNGVNRERFQPTESDLKAQFDGQKLVLAVASEWEERKGLRYLVQLSEQLGEGYRVAAIGLTQAQIEALPSSMTGIERTSSVRELAQWYSAADCFVNPTMEDNMPMVNLEALACGTPIAVFRTGGCPECVDDSCGAVVEKGDVDGLTSAVKRLCEQRESMRGACLARAERFDASECCKAYHELYREVVG